METHITILQLSKRRFKQQNKANTLTASFSTRTIVYLLIFKKTRAFCLELH